MLQAENEVGGASAVRMSSITLPDVTWPEAGQEFNVSSADIEGFLNEFLGAGRPVGDMWSLNYTDANNMG